MKEISKYQFVLAMSLAFAGVILIAIGLFIPPQGEIHPSLLAALGEILTFAGASIGMDYHYKTKNTSNE